MKKSTATHWVIIITISLFAGLSGAGLQAQSPVKSSSTLKEEKRKLEKEIQTFGKLLDDTRKFKKKSLNELKLINRQVYLSQKLLKTMKEEVDALEREMKSAQTTITALESDLTRIKEEYARLMVIIYRNMKKRPSSFYLFSSKSLAEGLQRIRFFKEVQKIQENRVELIRRTQDFLARKKLEIETKQVEKKELLQQQKEEAQKLVRLKTKQKELFVQLKEQEREYQRSLNKKKQQLIALNDAILKAISAETESEKKPGKNFVETLLPLTNSFKGNKGKIPWPLPSHNGTITRKFGLQTLGESNVKVKSNGIDITTLRGQQARAVFEGTVSSVMKVPLYGTMVIVRHGNFRTVYANLTNIQVEKGETVRMLQPLGTCITNSTTGETKIHFEIYQDKAPLDPEKWIMKRK